MGKLTGIFRKFLEYSLPVLLFFLFLAYYLYPDILKFIPLPQRQIPLIIMSVGALGIFFISRRKLGMGWQVFAILISILIIVETFFMGRSAG